MASSVGSNGNGPKPSRTDNLQPSVTFGENLSSIGCRKRSEAQVLFVREQKIFCWKLGRGCHFGRNGLIYIFNLFFVFFVFCLFLLFAVFLTIYLFIYLFIYSLIGSDRQPCTSHSTALFNDYKMRHSKNSALADALKTEQSHHEEKIRD